LQQKEIEKVTKALTSNKGPQHYKYNKIDMQ
jgi:hypothetical protein